MNLGWIRHLFTLSDLEKGRVKEAQPDPRRIEGFADIETLISQSLVPTPTVTVQTTTHQILNNDAQPKTATRTLERPLADQELLQKLLKHRPNYTSNRILRAGRTDQEGQPVIWGEVVEEIRRFHLALAQQVPALAARAHSPEAAFDPALVPFPEAQDGMDDWDPQPLEGKLGEWIEFHPVERALLEGPLLPIQQIKFAGETEYERFADAMIRLERAWIQSATRPGELPAEWETELKSRLLRLKTRAGFRQLRQA